MRIERHAASFRWGHGRDAAMDQSGAQAGQAIVHARRPCLGTGGRAGAERHFGFLQGGDGGLGAYLANIKQLSEENIRLTREVLLRVAEIQAKLAELPERMRRIFVEVQGYQLAQQTQTALNLLQAVEESYKQRGKLRDVDRRSCEQILQTCANLTGARAAAYGVGGTAASCIAVIGRGRRPRALVPGPTGGLPPLGRHRLPALVRRHPG